MTSTAQQVSSHIQSQPKQPNFLDLNDLASNQVGGRILFASDEWFGAADNLLKAETPEWKEGVFTKCGKWMDGWETRRKRTEGYDWCIVELGKPGVIYGFDVDTSYFTGSYAPRCSIQAACIDKKLPKRPTKGDSDGALAYEEQEQAVHQLNSEGWEYVVPLSELRAGYEATRHNYFTCNTRNRFTHLRFNIYPDGGVARLRVYGQVAPDWSKISPSQIVDLLSMDYGGICVGYSDAHFGHPRNLTNTGNPVSPADGWLTARKLSRPAVIQKNSKGELHIPGTEWCLFKLGHPGIITQVEIDTNHFQGNYPDSCRIEGCFVAPEVENSSSSVDNTARGKWRTLLSTTKLAANTRYLIDSDQINNCGIISHIRLVIAPDGGLSRLRVWGTIANKHTAKL